MKILNLMNFWVVLLKFGFYLTGAFGQSRALYRARNEAKRGRGSSEVVDAQILRDTKTIIDLQRTNGFAFVIDPMFKIYYLSHPFAENVSGVKEGPQENWFDNNAFYNRPQITLPIDATATGFTNKYIHLDLLPQDGTAMVILPSPYTLMALSTFGRVSGYEMAYADQRSAIIDLAQLIKEEAKSLAAKGVGRIQYDEPAIVHRQFLGSLKPEDISLLRLAMGHCGKIDGATTIANFYFGDAGPIIQQLLDLEVDGIGIDATLTRVGDIVRHRFNEKELAVGLVDARGPSLENPKDLVEILKRIANDSQPEALYPTPNTGTEYVGWDRGLNKVEILRKVKEAFETR